MLSEGRSAAAVSKHDGVLEQTPSKRKPRRPCGRRGFSCHADAGDGYFFVRPGGRFFTVVVVVSVVVVATVTLDCSVDVLPATSVAEKLTTIVVPPAN